MRELDQKEEVIKSVQEIAEQLLLENHPARLTIEVSKNSTQTRKSFCGSIDLRFLGRRREVLIYRK